MDSPISIAGFCSGVGMLEVAVRLGCEFFGWPTRTALLCEWEAYAAACLLARMEDKSLEPAPIFCGDLRDFDGRTFRGCLDIIAAGLPCQPYSLAGKQEGLSDQRSYGDGDGPIPNFLRIVSECRPAVVFCENVPPWVRGGWFRPVGEELCRLGYTLEQPLFVTAESVGASHRRERVFVLAHAAQRGFGIVRQPSRSDGQPDGSQQVVDDTAGARHNDEKQGANERSIAERCGKRLLSDGCETVADAESKRTHNDIAGWIGGGVRNIERSGQGLFAPGPGDFDGWRQTVADRSINYRAPAVKPGVRVLVDGVALVVDASRADQLRCGGNGVVPLQAAVAFVELMRRAMTCQD